jgi:hypothetical protein
MTWKIGKQEPVEVEKRRLHQTVHQKDRGDHVKLRSGCQKREALAEVLGQLATAAETAVELVRSSSQLVAAGQAQADDRCHTAKTSQAGSHTLPTLTARRRRGRAVVADQSQRTTGEFTKPI